MRHRNAFAILLSIICLSCCFCTKGICASGILQKRLSVNISKQPLSELLRTIEAEAGVRFMYNPQLLANKPAVSIRLTNATLKRILQVAINDDETVFYELNKYIIIARKVEVPRGVTYEQAAVSPADEPARQLYTDTIHIHDTAYHTVEKTITDTIRIYDTVRVQRPAAQTVSAPQPMMPKTPATKPHFAMQLELCPMVQKTASNPQDAGAPSLLASSILTYTNKNLCIGIGIAYFRQKGAARLTQTETRLDSTLNTATKTQTVRYESGYYFYTDSNGNTARRTLYDSATVDIPYQWYSYTQTAQTSDAPSAYTAAWIGIPLRIGYITGQSGKLGAGIDATCTPSLPVSQSGSINTSAPGRPSAQMTGSHADFALFASIAPYASYSISRRATIRLGAIAQISLMTVVRGEQYYSIASGYYMSAAYRFLD